MSNVLAYRVIQILMSPFFEYLLNFYPGLRQVQPQRQLAHLPPPFPNSDNYGHCYGHYSYAALCASSTAMQIPYQVATMAVEEYAEWGHKAALRHVVHKSQLLRRPSSEPSVAPRLASNNGRNIIAVAPASLPCLSQFARCCVCSTILYDYFLFSFSLLWPKRYGTSLLLMYAMYSSKLNYKTDRKDGPYTLFTNENTFLWIAKMLSIFS